MPNLFKWLGGACSADLSSTRKSEPAPNQGVVRPHQFERRAVAEARRHLGRTDDVGEHDSAQPDRRWSTWLVAETLERALAGALSPQEFSQLRV